MANELGDIGCDAEGRRGRAFDCHGNSVYSDSRVAVTRSRCLQVDAAIPGPPTAGFSSPEWEHQEVGDPAQFSTGDFYPGIAQLTAPGYFFCAVFFATRVVGKYPVFVRTVSLLMPGASAVTSTRRNPGSVEGFDE